MQRIIIIGAGPAGLTAGYEFLSRSKEYQVTLLEQSGEIGGISRTVCHHGNRMDMGGHRFFSKDRRVTDWWENMMPLQGAPALDDALLGRERCLPAQGPDPEENKEVMLIRQRISRIYYLKRFFDYPISMKWKTFRNMGFFRTMHAGFSYMKSIAHKREENSLEDFYINRFGKVLYGMFFEDYTEKLWGRHPRDLSADWGAQRVKGLSITAVMKDMLKKVLPKNKQEKASIETSLIEEFHYPKLGPGQLWEIAAKRIEALGGCVKMHAKVTQINTHNNRVTGVTYVENGERKSLECDVLVSSMPLKDLVASIGGGGGGPPP
ncbi:MAG: NAD(P)-binding protein, partial [Clostridia bacterium]|nr:NAD(P)-binding protein [Clostridia bacterium]